MTIHVYNSIGAPLSYYNGTRWTFTWEDGRQLATATDGTTSISYTYDSDGIRTSKTVDGVKHTYVYASGKLLRETFGDTTVDFFYSNSGQPYALSHNGTTYYYITNVQGDVTSIVDGTGAVVVSYEYDPYGNILSTTGTLADTLGQINPLRYRGYVYDTECNLYYLQSRYYDAKLGRFLNADSYSSTGQGILGHNMFAYCGSNPVNRADYTGQFWIELWEFVETVIVETGKAMGAMAPAYTGCGVAAASDGPLPVGDVIGAVGAALITVGLVGYGIYQATQAPAISMPKAEEKTEAIAIPTEPDRPVIFPVDPNTFNPVGLVKVPRTGTTNGSFISWMDPLTNTEVFRWDENPNYPNGPHYHINNPMYKKAKVHFYPEDLVPEPYATIYFPFE